MSLITSVTMTFLSVTFFHRKLAHIGGVLSKCFIKELTDIFYYFQEQQSTDRNGKVDASKRRNYENTSTALPQPIDIEQQGDKVLRYTRDPTFKDTNIKVSYSRHSGRRAKS